MFLLHWAFLLLTSFLFLVAFLDPLEKNDNLGGILGGKTVLFACWTGERAWNDSSIDGCIFPSLGSDIVQNTESVCDPGCSSS